MNFTIKNVKENQILEVTNIADEVFGKNYFKQFDLDNTIIAMVDNIVCGFGYYELKEEVGTLKTFAVKKDYQKKGIGSLLLKEMQKRLRELGAKKLVVPAWKNKEGINIEKLLIKFGYKIKNEINEFWKEDCDKGLFECPSRTNKCVCSNIIFELK